MPHETVPFEQIYTGYYPKILRYLTRLVGAKDAEDLCQEVFIKAERALSSFNHQSSLSTWLYRIATNAATDRSRSQAFKQETVTVCDSGPEPRSGGPGAILPPSPEDQVIRQEMNECIQAYVGSLPENYRAVLVLSELEGLKNSEIAAILGLSLATAKIRLHRAREKLRQELTANCDFYRTDCNQLACEPKGPSAKKFKPLSTRKS